MAASFIADDKDSTASGTTVSAGATLTMVDDDLLIALIHANNDGVTVTGLAGFTSADAGNSGSTGGASIAILYKTASSDSGDFTWTVSSSTRVSVILIQIRGAAAMAEDVFPAVTDGEETNSNSTEGPSIVVAANSMTFLWHLQDTSVTSLTFTGIDNGFTVGPAEVTADQLQGYGYKVTGAGATGETKYSRSNIQTHVGYSFSFKEGGGAPAAESELSLMMMGVGT